MHRDHFNSSYKKIAICIALMSLGSGSLSYADNNLSQKSSDEWQFIMAPYIWAASARGDIGLPKTGTHFVESSFSKIIKKVDLTAMLMGEAWKGPYSFLFDVMYVSASVKNNLSEKIPANHLKAKAKIATGFLAAGYTVLSTENLRLDAVAGLRGWHVDGHITLHGGYLDGVSGSTNKNWVDAIAGFRGRYDINEDFSVMSWALAGGGQAKSEWDLALLANWSITKDLTFTAGYRALKVNYNRNNYVFDVTQKGPLIGLSFKF